MKLFLLTRKEFFVEEDKILTALFDEGLDVLHIHKPEAEPVFAERLLTLLPESKRTNIMVHQHFYLKEEFGLMGVHLTPESEPLSANYKGKRSWSCHSIEELKAAKDKYDYIFLGPVFDSISSPDKTSLFSINALKEASSKGLINKRVVAVGGITPENIPLMKDLGFGGVCVLGDLWKHFSPHNTTNYKDLLQHFRTIRKAVD